MSSASAGAALVTPCSCRCPCSATLGEEGDGVAVDLELFVLDLNSALPLAVGGIVLEHVHHVIKVDERVVADLDVVVYSAT